MNYLAHMLLSDGTPEALLGNLAGDFVRGVDVSTMTPAMQAGVKLHRAVDRFTDSHPAVQQSRARLPQHWRHYRGVLVDVFYDHFLARNFEALGGEALDTFATRVYSALNEHAEALPPRLKRAAPIMIERDWLRAYTHFEGLEIVLQGMSRRARRDVALHESVGALRQNYTELRADFENFFPQLVQFASRVSV
ncbi:MAG: ACP phosphodiesterase [Planctomycetes bacterium]|nr:ACP phosphodiesterase [Planctomycetota bacterium]